MFKFFDNNPLFKECIEALGKKAKILSFEESKKIYSILEVVFPIGFSSINWEKVQHKVEFEPEYPEQIIPSISNLLGKINFDKEIYIISDNDVPVIKSDLDSVIQHIDDVTCIGQTLWFLNISLQYVVEWRFGYKYIGLATYQKINLGKKWKECLDSLDSDLKILSLDNSHQAFKLLKNKFGFNKNPVTWEIINKKIAINPNSIDQIIPTLKTMLNAPVDKSAYLLWDDPNLPVLETNLDLIVVNWNEIIKINSLRWIFSTSGQYVIEVQDDQILIGLKPQRTNAN